MKQPAPFFVTYARNDRAVAERFLEMMKPLFQISPNYDFQLWQGAAIVPGEKWKAEIDTALKTCRFGLLCVSPNLLASGFVSKAEFPVVLAKPAVIAVGMHPVLFDGTATLKGLREDQLFRDSQGRTFDACGRKNGRREFGIELMARIASILRRPVI